MCIAVLVSIGAGVGAAAGLGTGGPTTYLQDGAASILGAPSVEMRIHLAGSATGLPAILQHASVELEAATPNGAALSGAATHDVDAQLSVDVAGTDVADLRVVHTGTLYVRADLDAIGQLPGIPASTRRQLGVAAGFLSGRWFSVPTSVFSPVAARVHAQVPGTQPVGERLQSALMKVVMQLRADLQFASRPLGGHQTESVVSLSAAGVRALGATVVSGLEGLRGAVAGAHAFKNLDDVSVQASVVTGTDRPVASQASVSVLSSKGSVELVDDIRHDPLALGVPAGASPLPPAVLGPIERQLGTATGSSPTA